MIGETIANYLLLNRLGKGGMGTVYRARHQILSREIAIKLLDPSLCMEADMVERFFNEARAAACISHPGIVEIIDVGKTPVNATNVSYIAMELLHGEQLSRRIMREGRMAPAEALHVLAQLAEALEAAHAHGVVHRDLKPDNIILARDSQVGRERVKILDFGVAKLSRGMPMGEAAQAGIMLGTPKYMAPEQFHDAESVDHRADIYSLGCIAYELLSGKPLFSGNTPELSVRHQTEPVATLASHDLSIPPALDELIGLMLAKTPASRPATMGDVLQSLQHISNSREHVSSPEEDITLDVQQSPDIYSENKGICDVYATPAPANGAMSGRGRAAGTGCTAASIAKKLLWPLLLLLASAAEGSLIALLFLNQSIDRQDLHGTPAHAPSHPRLLSPEGAHPLQVERPGGDGHLLLAVVGQARSDNSERQAEESPALTDLTRESSSTPGAEVWATSKPQTQSQPLSKKRR